MSPENLLKNSAIETGKENQRKLTRVLDRKAKLEAAIEDMAQDGNWNYDPFMLGIYNGLVYARAILENKVPQYRDRPEGGFKINDPAVSAQLEAAQRNEDLAKAEKDSEQFKNKILGGVK